MGSTTQNEIEQQMRRATAVEAATTFYQGAGAVPLIDAHCLRLIANEIEPTAVGISTPFGKVGDDSPFPDASVRGRSRRRLGARKGAYAMLDADFADRMATEHFENVARLYAATWAGEGLFVGKRTSNITRKPLADPQNDQDPKETPYRIVLHDGEWLGSRAMACEARRQLACLNGKGGDHAQNDDDHLHSEATAG